MDGSDAIDNWENGRDQLIVPLACRERTQRSAVRKLTWACQPANPSEVSYFTVLIFHYILLLYTTVV